MDYNGENAEKREIMDRLKASKDSGEVINLLRKLMEYDNYY